MSCPVSSPESGPRATPLGGGDEASAGADELEHLLAAGGDQQQGHVAQVLREVVEEGEHGIVGPVQVLDDEHR